MCSPLSGVLWSSRAFASLLRESGARFVRPSVSHRKGEILSVTDFHSGEPLTEHPTAEDVAAYLSERLAPDVRAVLEEHLAECRECRQLVTSARRLLRSHRAPNRLVWLAPSAAAAVLVIAVLARAPGSAPGGNEPLRSDPGATGAELPLTISIVSPSDGQVVRERPIVFVWQSQPGKPLYKLSMTDASGREVWSAETSDTTIALPAEVSLDRGRTYFWTVDALGADGRSLTSRTKRFLTTP